MCVCTRVCVCVCEKERERKRVQVVMDEVVCTTVLTPVAQGYWLDVFHGFMQFSSLSSSLHEPLCDLR